MTKSEAKRHGQHLCDVWSLSEDHLGVIEKVHGERAKVSGHPVYGDRWFPLTDLGTNCKVQD